MQYIKSPATIGNLQGRLARQQPYVQGKKRHNHVRARGQLATNGSFHWNACSVQAQATSLRRRGSAWHAVPFVTAQRVECSNARYEESARDDLLVPCQVSALDDGTVVWARQRQQVPPAPGGGTPRPRHGRRCNRSQVTSVPRSTS